MSRELFTFFKAVLTNPKEVSAIFPASKFLANAILQEAQVTKDSKVLELGPGSGAITKYLLPLIPNKKNYVGLDINEEIILFLQKKYPEYRFLFGSAQNLKNLVDEEKFNSVISSLPWSVIPEKIQIEILDSLLDILSDRGSFLTYIYWQAIHFKNTKHFLNYAQKKFTKVERKKLVFLNAPPAYVYKFEK